MTLRALVPSPCPQSLRSVSNWFAAVLTTLQDPANGSLWISLKCGRPAAWSLAAEHRSVLAPVELERLPGCERQRHEGVAAGGLLGLMALSRPRSRERRHADIEPSKPSTTRSACICFSVARCLRHFVSSLLSQPESFPANGSGLLGLLRFGQCGSAAAVRRNFLTLLRDGAVRRAISRIGSYRRGESWLNEKTSTASSSSGEPVCSIPAIGSSKAVATPGWLQAR